MLIIPQLHINTHGAAVSIRRALYPTHFVPVQEESNLRVNISHTGVNGHDGRWSDLSQGTYGTEFHI